MADKIILIHETWRQSAARDATSAATILGLWGVGYLVGSPALEWIGAIIGFLVLLSRAAAMRNTRMTPNEAREWLDRHYKGNRIAVDLKAAE